MSGLNKYFVYNPREGKPRVMHETYEIALEEAKRINQKCQEKVYVLHIEAVVTSKIMQNVHEVNWKNDR